MHTHVEYPLKADDLQKICADLQLPEEVSREAAKLNGELGNAQLPIPIIGAFSSGKATLLNTVRDIGELLPTAITPETSLALEMRRITRPNTAILISASIISRS